MEIDIEILIMHKFRTWWIGLTWAVTLSELYSQFVESATCPEVKIKDMQDSWMAFCNNTKLSEVPQDLNKRLRFLNLTKCNWLTLRSDSFTRYPLLIWLELNDLNVSPDEKEPSCDEDTFIPLENLRYLEMMRTLYTTNFKWPPNIEDLFIDGYRSTNLSLTRLSRLRRLSVSNLELEDVPEIHELAPFRELWAIENPFRKLTLEKLASLCILREVQLKLTKFPIPLTPEEYCRCTRISVWLRALDMDGVFVALPWCLHNEMNYTNYLNVCGTNYTEGLKNRRTCRTRLMLFDDTHTIQQRLIEVTFKLSSFWNLVVNLLPWFSVGIAAVCVIIDHFKRVRPEIHSTSVGETVSEEEVHEHPEK